MTYIDGKPNLVPEDQLVEYVCKICEEKFNVQKVKNMGVTASIDGATCPAWWRLSVLVNRGLVKKRSLKKNPVYELLPAGRALAQRLRGERAETSDGAFRTSPLDNEITYMGTEPTASFSRLSRNTGDTNATSSASHPVTDNKPSLAQIYGGSDSHKANSFQERALYTNDKGEEGLCMLVDIREAGGDRAGLGHLCSQLARNGVRYATRSLKIGDYNWIWRCAGCEIELPLLVERKRADDLACSLRDGRYISQNERMKKWKQQYEEKGITASLLYLVEGKPEDYAVKCSDGCGAVSKCGFPTVKQVYGKMKELDASGEFELCRSDNIEKTVELLIHMDADLQHRLSRGEFDKLLHLQAAAVPTQKSDLDVSLIKSTDYKPPIVIILDDDDDGDDISLISDPRLNQRNRVSEDTHCSGFNIHVRDEPELIDTAPLAQFHTGVSSPCKDAASTSVPLCVGEIPATRGRYVAPSDPTHQADVSDHLTHTPSPFSALDSMGKSTAPCQKNYISPRKRLKSEHSPSSIFNKCSYDKNLNLDIKEETTEPSTKGKVDPRRTCSDQLEDIKGVVGNTDDVIILSLLERFHGDTNQVVSSILDTRPNNSNVVKDEKQTPESKKMTKPRMSTPVRMNLKRKMQSVKGSNENARSGSPDSLPDLQCDPWPSTNPNLSNPSASGAAGARHSLRRQDDIERYSGSKQCTEDSARSGAERMITLSQIVEVKAFIPFLKDEDISVLLTKYKGDVSLAVAAFFDDDSKSGGATDID